MWFRLCCLAELVCQGINIDAFKCMDNTQSCSPPLLTNNPEPLTVFAPHLGVFLWWFVNTYMFLKASAKSHHSTSFRSDMSSEFGVFYVMMTHMGWLSRLCTREVFQEYDVNTFACVNRQWFYVLSNVQNLETKFAPRKVILQTHEFTSIVHFLNMFLCYPHSLRNHFIMEFRMWFPYTWLRMDFWIPRLSGRYEHVHHIIYTCDSPRSRL